MEESVRLGSDIAGKSLSDYTLFMSDDVEANDELRSAFEKMQNIYIFQPSFRRDWLQTIRSVQKMFRNHFIKTEDPQYQNQNIGNRG